LKERAITFEFEKGAFKPLQGPYYMPVVSTPRMECRLELEEASVVPVSLARFHLGEASTPKPNTQNAYNVI
jgi:hypothetical protein